MKPPKPLKNMSVKRTAESKVYAKKKKAFLLIHTSCGRCGKWIEKEYRELHHWAKRAGKLYLEDRLWMCLCNKCHSWVHDNEKRAQNFGWLAPAGCVNDHTKALKAFDKLEWQEYLNELDGVE